MVRRFFCFKFSFSYIVLLISCLYIAGSVVNAQVVYNNNNTLALAQQKVLQARQVHSGVQASVDHPFWTDALNHLDRVYRANPRNLEVLYFGTGVYAEVGWDYMAWEFGRAYRDVGGVFDESMVQTLTSVGNDLGYSYAEAGNTEYAIAYFEAVAQINPQDSASVQNIGQIYNEAGFLEEAAAYWTEASNRGSLGAQYLLERLQLEQLIGVEATSAYYYGIEHYEAGRLVEANDAFSIAVEANPNFTESWRWLARTLMESCISQDALWAWQNYMELVPTDETASYFVGVVNEHLRNGCEAGQAYVDGLSLYESSLFVEANEYFVYATTLNSEHLDAHVWSARTYQELGDYQSALYYWYAAQALAPDDEAIAYFIDLLEGNVTGLTSSN